MITSNMQKPENQPATEANPVGVFICIFASITHSADLSKRCGKLGLIYSRGLEEMLSYTLVIIFICCLEMVILVFKERLYL